MFFVILSDFSYILSMFDKENRIAFNKKTPQNAGLNFLKKCKN